MSRFIVSFSDNIDRWAESAGNWVDQYWPWLFVIAVTLGLLLAVLAPVLMALGAEWAARPIYWLYSHICHQRPERTLWIAGRPMAFCARDTGLYGGLWLGMLLFSIKRRWHISGAVAVICALPLAVDGGMQLIGLRESTNALRLITGLLAGLAAALYLLPKVNTHTTTCLDDTLVLTAEEAAVEPTLPGGVTGGE